MKLKMLTLLILFALISVPISAQKKDKNQDVVHLKNGSVVKGEIIDFEQGKYLKMMVRGEEIEFGMEEVEKVVQSSSSEKEKGSKKKEKGIPKLNTKGFYNITYLTFSSGRNLGTENSPGTASLGAGIHNVFGKQLNRNLGLGLGIGIDNYRPSRGETVYPVYLDIRGYPIKKNKAFYYDLGVGWGFAFENQNRGIRQADGGFMVNPVIGFRSASEDGTSLNLEIGWKMQKAFFLEESIRTAMDIEERDILYKRFSVKLGLMFWK